MSKYMGQIMAECDCQHQACEMRGYCMAARIEQLELAAFYEDDLAQQALDAREELEAKLEKVVEALQSMPEAVEDTTLDDGPLWPEERIDVWLATLHACKNVVQSKVDQILAELKGQE